MFEAYFMHSLNPGRVKNFHSGISAKPPLGPTQPPSQLVLGYISYRVKWQGREGDHSPPTSAEVKKAWMHTSIPPYVFMTYCLIKYMTNSFYSLQDHCFRVFDLQIS
jgi:hypothetical protein